MSATTTKPVIIVTGGSKGIGLAATTILLDVFNAAVVSLSRTTSNELQSLKQEHPEDLLCIEVDVSNDIGVRAAIGQAVTKYGRIDGVILNAGVLEPVGPIALSATSIDAWRAHFDVNFFSLVHTIQATLPSLKQAEHGGKIVFVSSGAAVGNTAGWGPYNASKAAMNSLCRTLAQEEPDVTCVALRPGMVDTNMQALLRSIGGDVMRPDDFKRFTAAHEGGKLVKPEDAGHVVASLSLHATKSMSGQFVSWDSPECATFRRGGK